MNLKSKLPAVSSVLPSTILTIFGATGDLSADYLLPALMHMKRHKILPKSFKVVAVGRRDLTAKTYLDFVIKKSGVFKKLSLKDKNDFLKHIIYYRGDFESPESFDGLKKVLEDNDKPEHNCSNRLFYFATKPQQFADIVHILKSQGLLAACALHKRQSRVLVEKPFGFNLKSAKFLNSLLLKYFSEDQIYRIDHYVGKETVQNLIVARFANTIFEPLWNREFVDHIEISVMYNYDIKDRIEFYDQTGALKDVIQNHALQMLALILMDEPKELTAEHIRGEKVNILSALQPFSSQDIKNNIVKGQYEGYASALGNQSKTETYLALKVYVNSSRWKGVPIYIKTGKAVKETVTEISIHFKELKRCLFKGCDANVLTFRIQPNESVHLQLNNKMPGLGIDLHQSNLQFSYDETFKNEIPSAYERLLLDFIQGDQRLFIRSDEIEAAWGFVDSITESETFKNLPVYKYKTKSSGPKEADEWIGKDFKKWWTK